MALVRPQKKAPSQKALELEAAREILSEVFHARPGEVDEIIQRRLEESWPEEREICLISLPFRKDYTFRKAYILQIGLHLDLKTRCDSQD